MQKYVALLEQHVHWLAIGLGGAFVLFMVWAYVLTPPAQVTIANEKLGPGEVDPYTEEHVVKQLETAINNNEKITVEVPKHVARFRDEMAWKVVPADETRDFAAVWNAPSHDIVLPKPPAVPGRPGQPTVPGAVPGAIAQSPVPAGKVAALPEPPPAIPDVSRFGRSLVFLPPPVAAPGADAAAAPAPPAPAPGQPGDPGVDKDWVTQLFKLNMADIDAAFKSKGLPPGDFSKTVFLQVEMEREELDAAGNPVPNTLTPIKPLGVWRQQPPPEFPADGVQFRDQQQAYLQWASTATGDVIQPLFYPTNPTKGDQWIKPGDQAQNQQQAFDPLQYLTGPIPTWITTEQKAQINKARQEATKKRQDELRKSKPTPAKSAPGSRGGPAGPGLEGAPNYAPARPAQPPPPPRVVPRPTGPRDIEGGGEGGFGPGLGGFGPGLGGGGAAAPNITGLPIAGTDYPNGDFDPGILPWKGKTIEIWAHDDTVQAGKTYHYRIRYKIKNPIWAAANVAQNPDLANVFALISKDSAWGTPITIPQLVNFFVQSSKSPLQNTVRFDVFKYEKGSNQLDTVTVSPGDQIGGKKGEVDYSTDWTVVDFREDPRQGDTQILLVNNKDGSVTVRSYKGDQNDPLYQGLKKQVEQTRAAEAATAGAAGGGAPVIR